MYFESGVAHSTLITVKLRKQENERNVFGIISLIPMTQTPFREYNFGTTSINKKMSISVAFIFARKVNGFPVETVLRLASVICFLACLHQSCVKSITKNIWIIAYYYSMIQEYSSGCYIQCKTHKNLSDLDNEN